MSKEKTKTIDGVEYVYLTPLQYLTWLGGWTRYYLGV
jgi:hypothetical protein